MPAWLDALDHWDPRVGPEYVTRHHLMAELLDSDDTHRQRHGHQLRGLVESPPGGDSQTAGGEDFKNLLR